jgi:hypothetical protein
MTARGDRPGGEGLLHRRRNGEADRIDRIEHLFEGSEGRHAARLRQRQRPGGVASPDPGQPRARRALQAGGVYRLGPVRGPDDPEARFHARHPSKLAAAGTA